MIADNEIVEIGKVLKTHGINGEMSVVVDRDSIADAISADTCLIFNIDGINVPFFVASSRRRGADSLLIVLDGEETQQQAAAFVGKPVYMLESDADIDTDDAADDGVTYASDLIGYTATTIDGEVLGRIIDVDDSTDNPLFIIEHDERDKALLVPVADEFITAIDTDNQTIEFELPQGLTDL